MANILNITPPAAGQEGHLNKVRPAGDGANVIQQLNDPSKVVKPDNQNVHPDRHPNQYSPNLESNFDKFLQTLRNSPGLTQLYSELFFSKMGNIVNAGIGENFAQEMAKFMQLLKVDDAQLLELLKGQQGQSVKFSGPFFDALRQVINSNAPNDLKVTILDFLRRYDNLTSSNHIMNNISANLENISSRIPNWASTQLAEMTAKLSRGEMLGNNPQNLAVLKNEIMPFLSKYIAVTKDMGTVRDLITMLTLNVARYETGTKESFMQGLRALTSYDEIGRLLRGISVDELASRLMTSGKNQGNALVDQLISVIAKGLANEAGYQNKGVFQNLVTSFLINESVYMPLLHCMIPADVNGMKFFSELWADPNAEGEGREGEGRAVKLLVKFDIKDVGFFETIILAQNRKVDMELYYPDRYVSRELEIKEAMTRIMEKNNLSFRSLFMARCETPKSISEVFPKVYERRNAINVVI